MKYINPSTMKAPSSQYSHGVEVGPGARWLHVSGQTALGSDGSAPEDFGDQVKATLASVNAVLEGAGMKKSDLVKLIVFATVSGPEVLATYRKLRDEWLEGNAPASTFLVVAGLASAKIKVEIEAIAATDAA